MHTQRAESTTHGLEVPIGGAPTQLLDDLIGDRLERLTRRQTARTAIAEEMAASGEVSRDLLGLLVSAAHFDDIRPEQSYFAHLLRRHQAGHEHPEFDASPRTGRGVGYACIPGRCDDALVDAGFQHGR